MKNHKNWLRNTLVVAIGALMSTTAMAEKTIRLAHHLPKSSEQHIAAERFEALVEQRSEGQLQVEILPAGQLGGQREIIEGVQLGTVEMGYGESGLYANYVPAFGLLTLPYLYTGPEHWEKVVKGPIGEGLVKQLESSSDLVVMNWILAGYRDTYSVDRQIKSPADFKDLKIRVPESPVFIKTFSALGAQPTPIPSPEIYTALQAGVVGAMEGTPEVGMIQKMYEVTKHLNKTRHILFDGSFVSSGNFLSSLSASEREIVMTAAEEVAALQRQEQAEREANWFEQLAETGIAIHEVDSEAFRQALKPVQDEFAKAAKATDTIEAIRQAGAQ